MDCFCYAFLFYFSKLFKYTVQMGEWVYSLVVIDFFSDRIWALVQLIFDLFCAKHTLLAEECERDLLYIDISLKGLKHLSNEILRQKSSFRQRNKNFNMNIFHPESQDCWRTRESEGLHQCLHFLSQKKKATLKYAKTHLYMYKMAPSCSSSLLNFVSATLGCFIFHYGFCDLGSQEFEL